MLSDQIVQTAIGSAQLVNSPKYLICAHQSRTRSNTRNWNSITAIFDNLDLRKYHVQIDFVRYPRDPNLKKHEKNDFIAQYKNQKFFFKEYIGEPILNPLVTYQDMKTKYPIRIFDLRHQSDHITPKKIQLILFRRTEIETISDGNTLLEIEVI